MRTTSPCRRRCLYVWAGMAALLLSSGASYAQKNVIQPSDPILASSANHPGSEGVKNAIDGTQAKYLNFDMAHSAKPAGFVVTPAVGPTWVTGISMQSANDAPERDPKRITIEGSNDDTIADFNSGNWELIYTNGTIPSWTEVWPGGNNVDRYQTQTFTFQNLKPYKHYRWTVLEVQADNTCCMQIAEVQLLGTTVPLNVVQPADNIIASSANHPGSEGVKNAIDGTQAKYLNFDMAHSAKPAGFVVTPAVGPTVINGISMQSANDAPERDPKRITLEGSNDDTIADFNSGNWELVYTNGAIPAWTELWPGGNNVDRYKTQTFLFDNVKPYKHYRWTVLEVQADNTCCMQIAEVSLLGSGAPKNVVQPSDNIIASSANHPGSEGVKNAIDGTQAKYLNFDMAHSAKPAGFVVTPAVGATAVTGISMQSANDAPERDPKRITLEGSNDDTIADFNSGNWELVYTNGAIPAWTEIWPGGNNVDRYQTQTFYFPNKKTYKHYRWTVLEVQADNTCCMQIAEVALLAVTSANDCGQAAFVLQPDNTPVLNGAAATFFTTVNGPWTLQWMTNGVPIPGAGAASFTTAPVTAANADIEYSVAIVGCQTSAPVKAVIFTPSTVRSVGVQFSGGGANGTPSYTTTNDIGGVHIQAYFNAVTNSSANYGLTGDGVSQDVTLLDSDGKATDITFEYTTTGHWGAGVGTDTATQRLLNGIAGANDAADGAQVMTFYNVPAGTHSLLIYAMSPPLQFQTAAFTVTSPASTVTNYIAIMNSDQYKPAPGFYRATSTNPNAPSLGNFLRFDNITLAAAGAVTFQFNIIKAADRETGVTAVQLLLNSPPAGAPPVITQEPQPVFGPAGGTVALTVQATGNDLTYQWRKDGYNLQDNDHVSGARSSTLTISNFSENDQAVYSVAVFSPAGSTVSKNATASISNYDIMDALAGYWKFDQSSGASVPNVVSGGLPIVLDTSVSQPTWSAGKVGNALNFDGISTFGVVSNYPKATRALTVAAWVNMDANAGWPMTIARNGLGNIRAPGDNSPAPTGNFEMRIQQDAALAFFLNSRIQAGPNFPEVSGPVPFPGNAWTHVAFTADGAQMRMYVNGQEVDTADYFDDFKTSTIDILSVGARMNTNELNEIILDADPAYLLGKMDELAIWNRALPVSEITAIYQAGASGQSIDTVVLEPPAGPPTVTVSSSGNNITVTWDHGTLQTAPAANGPWIDQSSATSPLTEAMGTGAKFYRARN